MKERLLKFFKDEEGATAVEYSLIAAAIAAVILAVVYAVGGKVNQMFTDLNTGFGS